MLKQTSHFGAVLFVTMCLRDLLNTAKMKHPFSWAISREESKQNSKGIFNSCRNLWLRNTKHHKVCMKLIPAQSLILKSHQGYPFHGYVINYDIYDLEPRNHGFKSFP